MARQSIAKKFAETGLSRRGVVPVDRMIIQPLERRVRGQIAAADRDHQTRIPMQLDDLIQFMGDTRTADGCICLGGQAIGADPFARQDNAQQCPDRVIKHVQHPEPTPVFQSVRHEVKRPLLLRPLLDCHGRPNAQNAHASAQFTPGYSYSLQCLITWHSMIPCMWHSSFPPSPA